AVVEAAVESAHGLDDALLPCNAHASRARKIEHRLAARTELHALITARQEPGAPLARGDRLVLRAARGDEDDESRQIVALAAEAVPKPRSHRRTSRDRRPGVHEGVSRIVIDLLRAKRADDADLVGDRPDVRKRLGDLLAGGAPPSKGMLRTEAMELLSLELRDRLPRRDGCGHVLAVHLRELRLRVEGLEVRRPSRHDEEDHAFRTRA